MEVVMAVLATAVAGLLIAGLTGLGKRLWSSVRPRLASQSPLDVRLIAHETYSGGFGWLAAVPTSSLDAFGHGERTGELVVRERGMFASGTPLVLSILNTSRADDARPVRLTEIDLLIGKTEQFPGQGVSLLQSTTIQAGGRGAEGWFRVRWSGSTALVVRLFEAAAAEQREIIRGIVVGPSQRAEIGVQLFPMEPGVNEIGFVLHWDENGHQGTQRVDSIVRSFEIQNRDWSEERLRVGIDQYRTWLTRESIAEIERERSELIMAWLADCLAPTGARRLTVCGGVDEHAWG